MSQIPGFRDDDKTNTSRVCSHSDQDWTFFEGEVALLTTLVVKDGFDLRSSCDSRNDVIERQGKKEEKMKEYKSVNPNEEKRNLRMKTRWGRRTQSVKEWDVEEIKRSKAAIKIWRHRSRQGQLWNNSNPRLWSALCCSPRR